VNFTEAHVGGGLERTAEPSVPCEFEREVPAPSFN